MFENVVRDRCPVCSGIIGYYINSYGQIVKKCNSCGNVVADDIVTTYTTDTNGVVIYNDN